MSRPATDYTDQGIVFGVIAGFLLSLLLEHPVWLALGPALGLTIGGDLAVSGCAARRRRRRHAAVPRGRRATGRAT